MTQKTLNPRTTAKGLASLGRQGDSTLVHMSPREVQGLQNIALRHGTTMTINPSTGLPEAFNLNKLLPTLGGIAVGLIAPEALPYVAAGGAALTKAEGGSLMKSLRTGLEIYGGGQLASGFGAAGEAAQTAGAPIAETTTITPPVTPTVAPPVVPQTEYAGADLVGATPPAVPPTAAPTVPVGGTGGNFLPEGIQSTGTPGTYFNSNTGEMFSTASGEAGKELVPNLAPEPTTYTTLKPGAEVTKADFTSPKMAAAGERYNAESLGDRWTDVKSGLSAEFSPSSPQPIGAPFENMDMAGKAGLYSGIMGASSSEPAKKPDEHKPVYYIQKPGGPALYEQGKINPNIAEKGYLPVGEEAIVGEKFNEGVYSYSPVEYKPVDWDKQLRHGGLASIKRMASGGDTDGKGNFVDRFSKGFFERLTGYNPDKHSKPEDDVVGMAEGGASGEVWANKAPLPQNNAAPKADNTMANMNQYFSNQLTNTTAPPSSLNAPKVDTSNEDWIANYNKMVSAPPMPQTQSNGVDPNTQKANDDAAAAAARAKAEAEAAAKAKAAAEAARIQQIKDQEAAAREAQIRLSPGTGNYAATSVTGRPAQTVLNTNNSSSKPNNFNYAYGATPSSFNYGYGGVSDYNYAFAGGGLANLSDSYAAGGKLLRGPGDGMSDSIPAVIGGQKPQRAALADGEFVVPADVVSHLGNGSTEAGSRKLYAMMDKVRKARTGKKKQAPAVKADRFMPK